MSGKNIFVKITISEPVRMKKIAFFDTKNFDRESFDPYAREQYEFLYFKHKLSRRTVGLAAGCDAVCVFVNDDLSAGVIDALCAQGVGLIALRCAGFDKVDLAAAKGKIPVVRVPAYSPYAVAEHAMGLFLMLNRHLHRAYVRTRDHNFSLEGLMGFDLHGRTAGVIGTGKIGRCFADICRGFGMTVLGSDPYESNAFCGRYVTLDRLLQDSDVISLHCPLTKENEYLIDRQSIEKMKNGAFIINTSRGGLIDTHALFSALKSRKLGGACLDVYEDESSVFFEDYSNRVLQDDLLSSVIALPNVVVTSHQAYLTVDALNAIAKVTCESFDDFFAGRPLQNEVVAK